MKKLVVITHPDLTSSLVNKTWVQTLEKYPDHFTLHSLYDVYPDLNFNIQAEQELLARYEEVIFQFPIHWFSTPFALKKYIDEVFTYGWAFGPEGEMLKGKKIGFAVSTGGKKESYESSSGISVPSLLNDFQLSFIFCGCEITHIHVFYGAMENPSEEELSTNSHAYVNTFLELKSIVTV